MTVSARKAFALVCASCRWPPSEARALSIRACARDVDDWDVFVRVVDRQSVAGLTYAALQLSGVILPPGTHAALAERARRIGEWNAKAAIETARLQKLFDDAGIPALFVKGSTLAVLCYGSLSEKQSGDIDLVVPPELAEPALRLLERDGYALCIPSSDLKPEQVRAILRFGKEFGLSRAGIQVELHWRFFVNPHLLAEISACAPTQTVSLDGAGTARTLTQADLFAYLCAHGALHGWSQLKWLADLNAFLAGESENDVYDFYRHARRLGSGLCAGQALQLCRTLFALPLHPQLVYELGNSRRLSRLCRVAQNAMTGRDYVTHLEDRPIANIATILSGFLLGRGLRYFAAQLGTIAVGNGDVVALALPERWHGLYPLLRIPLLLYRRSNYLIGRAPWHTATFPRTDSMAQTGTGIRQP